jgi:Ca-activated chloride channel family protein
MDFQWPLLLWTLASVPVLIGLYVLAQRRRYRHAARFTNVDLLADVVPSTPGWRRHVPVALFLLALTALLVSLARPEAVIQVPKEQATVVMVIDVSGSMNATDVFPTRMDSAREAAGSFLEMVPEQFRIGLVTFSNTAQVVSPPTTDRDMVLAGLNSMRARGGTAMGDGIEQALALSAPDLQQPPAAPGTEPEAEAEAEDGEEPPPRVILLLSDGYNTAGRSPLEVALEAQQEDVTIFTVALGTQEGTVEVPGPGGVPRIIAVPPDEATLERIASMTDGSFFTAPTDNDLQQVYEALGSQIGYDSEHQEVTVVFSAAGAALMVLGALLSLLWVRSFP